MISSRITNRKSQRTSGTNIHARRKVEQPIALVPLGRQRPQCLVDSRRRIRDEYEVVRVAIDKLGEPRSKVNQFLLVFDADEAVRSRVTAGLNGVKSIDDGARSSTVGACNRA